MDSSPDDERGARTPRSRPDAVAPPRRDIDEVPFKELFPTLPGTLSLAGALGRTCPRGLLALRRHGARYFSDIDEWRLTDLRRLRNVGARTAADIVTALADEEARAEASPPNTRLSPVRQDPDLARLQRTWGMSAATATLAAWTVAFVDPGMTFSAALDAADAADDLPADVEFAVRTIRDTEVGALAMHVRPIAPGDALSEWLGSLTERELVVLRLRTLARIPATLDMIGRQLGVSAERVRTLETGVRASAANLFSPDWLPLGRMLRALAEVSAPLAPVADLPTVGLLAGATAPWIEITELDLLARLSGRAVVEDDLIGWPDVTSWLELLQDVLGSMARGGPVVVEDFGRVLAELSVRGGTEYWLERCGYEVRGDTAALPPRNATERAHRLLTEVGEPMSTDEILARLGVVVTARSIREAMDVDARIIRVGPQYWALAAPDRREFPGLRDAISVALAEHGGDGMAFGDLLAALRVHYVVASHSVRVYAGRPPFEARNGMVSTASSS